MYACSFSGVNTPDELDGCLGIYSPVLEEEKQIVLSGRRVYELADGTERHEDHGYLEVWWADGYWWMGTSTSRGRPEGLLRRKSSAPTPSAESVSKAGRTPVLQEWEVYEGVAWKGTRARVAWRKTDIVCTSVPLRMLKDMVAEQEEEERISMWNEQLTKVKELLGALTHCTASQHFALIKFILTALYIQRRLYLSTLLAY